MKPTDEFYTNQEEPNKACFLAMRETLLHVEPRICETTKYGMPCFTLNKKPFCYLWADKKSGLPYFLFVDGDKLHHTALEQGNRKKMKTLSVNPKKDLPIDLIHEILETALALRI